MYGKVSFQMHLEWKKRVWLPYNPHQAESKSSAVGSFICRHAV